MGASDLLVSVSQRRLPCVIEPALALGHARGPALALRLTQVFETWLTRSFWQVIDASELLARARHRDAALALVTPDAQALQAWITMREGTDAGAWTLRWLGDCVAESQLSALPAREAAPIELVERYERLAAALLARLPAACDAPRERHAVRSWCAGFDPTLSSVDVLALAACLDGALILCREAPSAPTEPVLPQPIATLAGAEVAVSEIDPDDRLSLFAAERTVLRSALAAAGLAPLTHGLPRLALARVLADAPAPADSGDSADPWHQARAWWYWL